MPHGATIKDRLRHDRQADYNAFLSERQRHDAARRGAVESGAHAVDAAPVSLPPPPWVHAPSAVPHPHQQTTLYHLRHPHVELAVGPHHTEPPQNVRSVVPHPPPPPPPPAPPPPGPPEILANRGRAGVFNVRHAMDPRDKKLGLMRTLQDQLAVREAARRDEAAAVQAAALREDERARAAREVEASHVAALRAQAERDRQRQRLQHGAPTAAAALLPAAGAPTRAAPPRQAPLGGGWRPYADAPPSPPEPEWLQPSPPLPTHHHDGGGGWDAHSRAPPPPSWRQEPPPPQPWPQNAHRPSPAQIPPPQYPYPSEVSPRNMPPSDHVRWEARPPPIPPQAAPTVPVSRRPVLLLGGAPPESDDPWSNYASRRLGDPRLAQQQPRVMMPSSSAEGDEGGEAIGGVAVSKVLRSILSMRGAYSGEWRPAVASAVAPPVGVWPSAQEEEEEAFQPASSSAAAAIPPAAFVYSHGGQDNLAAVVAGGGVPATYAPAGGFTVAIDGARMLPDNVTFTRAVGQFVTAARAPWGRPFECPCLPVGDARNPSFGFSAFFDSEFAGLPPPHLTLSLRLETVDRDSMTHAVVGHALLAVFASAATLPLTQPDLYDRRPASAVYLNTGGHQLPLHVRGAETTGPEAGGAKGGAAQGGGRHPPGLGPSPTQPLAADDLAASVPRLPCASLLVRLVPGKDLDGQGAGAESFYDQGIYDTGRAEPTALEARLYAGRFSRPPLPMATVAAAVARGAGGPTARPPTESHALGRWIAEAVRPPPRPSGVVLMAGTGGHSLPVASVPLNYFRGAEYDPAIGLRIAVDGGTRLPVSLPSACLHSLYPPGSYYAKEPLGAQSVRLSAAIDLDGEVRTTRWRDGFFAHAGVAFDPRASAVLDVRGLSKTGEVIPMGWALLPLFHATGHVRAVAAGAFHLPLFEGAPSLATLALLTAPGADHLELIPRLLKLDKLRYVSSRAGVLVRLLDAQWAGQIPRPAVGHHSRSELEKYACPPYLPERDRAELRQSLGSKTYRESVMVPGAVHRGEAVTPAAFSAAMARGFARGLCLPGWEAMDDDWAEFAAPKVVVLARRPGRI